MFNFPYLYSISIFIFNFPYLYSIISYFYSIIIANKKVIDNKKNLLPIKNFSFKKFSVKVEWISLQKNHVTTFS